MKIEEPCCRWYRGAERVRAAAGTGHHPDAATHKQFLHRVLGTTASWRRARNTSACGRRTCTRARVAWSTLTGSTNRVSFSTSRSPATGWWSLTAEPNFGGNLALKSFLAKVFYSLLWRQNLCGYLPLWNFQDKMKFWGKITKLQDSVPSVSTWRRSSLLKTSGQKYSIAGNVRGNRKFCFWLPGW